MNVKVYGVFAGKWNGAGELAGVFSTREKADAFCALQGQAQNPSQEIYYVIELTVK